MGQHLWRKSAWCRFIYENTNGREKLGALRQVVLVDHLTSGQLGAFLANALTEEERDAVERHLVACAECRSDLVQAQRAVITAPSARRTSRRHWITLGALAAAAVLVVAVWPRNNVTRSPVPIERDAPVTPVTAEVVTIVSPSANGEIDEATSTFTWNRDDGSSYRITVTDEGGRPLWTETTNDTSVVLPATAQLPRGARFFWYVDALRPDGRSVTSGINAFRTPR